MIMADAMEKIQNTEETTKRKLNKTVLDNFSKLGNPHESVRIKSASNLIKYISESHKKDKDVQELKYALKRLIRGLGATTIHSKTGYYCTFITLLSQDFDINVGDILSLIETDLHKSGKNSDSENANICTGQILCCGALLKSKLWKKCDKELRKKIFDILITASKERSYLTLVGYSFVIKFLKQVSEKQFEKVLWPSLQPEIAKPWNLQTLDSLYLLLCLKRKFPTIFNKSFFNENLKTPDLFCSESLASISNILMNVPRVTYIQHPIYTLILNKLSSKYVYTLFEALDNHLKMPNRNRLLIFIKILCNALTNIEKRNEEYISNIPHLFTRNFITQLLGYFRTLNKQQKDNQFVSNVHNLFDIIATSTKSEKIESDIKITILKKLMFDPGTFVFEKVTKSKLIQQIIATLDSEGIQKLAIIYRNVINGSERINSENDSERWVNNDRLYSAHLLIKLLNLPNMNSENKWKIEQLCFLMEISFFRGNGNVGRELAETIKTAFFRALDLKLSKLEDILFILYQLVTLLNSKLTADNLEVILRDPISPQAYELWAKTIKVVNKIEKKKRKDGVNTVFLTLFLHMGLQLFNDCKLAEDSLNELFNCYERVKRNKKLSLNSTSSVEEEVLNQNDTDFSWIEVVTDLFLSLLSHSSHLLRSIIRCVFPHLCPHMTTSTINQILSVLDPENENPLSKGDASDASSDEDNDNSENELEDNEDEEDESGDDDEDDALDNNETGTDKLKMALHQALYDPNMTSDNESIDLDTLSDTEGEKLDKALADAFRQYRPNHGKRKKQSKDQEILTHFRVRVLDLIEMYIDSTPSMQLTLEIMLPLLHCVEFSIKDEHQKPLYDRLKAVLKKLFGLKKFCDTEGVTDEVLVELLKSLLEKGTKNMMIVQDMEQQLADCCTFTVKCSEILCSLESTTKKMKKSLKKNILKILSGQLHQFFMRRESLIPYVLFKNVLQLSWDGNVVLAIILLDFLFDDSIKQFRQNQVVELLGLFYSNKRFFNQNLVEIQEAMTESHKQFSEKIVHFFKELCEEPDKNTIKERFVSLLFNFLTCLKNSLLRIDINWTEIGNYIREYRSYKSFSTDAKQSYNKLCRTLCIPNVVQMKNNVTKFTKLEENQEEEKEKINANEDSNTKKRKKHNKEKLKLKKESKKLRLASLNIPLHGNIFQNGDNLLNDTNMDVELNTVDEIPTSFEEQDKTNKGNGDKKSNICKRRQSTSLTNNDMDVQVDGADAVPLNIEEREKDQINNKNEKQNKSNTLKRRQSIAVSGLTSPKGTDLKKKRHSEGDMLNKKKKKT